MAVVRVLVWMWVIGSLVAWVMLRINKRKGLDLRGRPLADGPVGLGTSATSGPPSDLAAALDPRGGGRRRPNAGVATPQASSADQGPLPTEAEILAAAAPLEPPAPVVDPQASRADLADTSATAGALWGDRVPDRPPEPSGAAGAAEGAPEPAEQRSLTVAEALSGLRWPCELTPMVDTSALTMATKRAVFTTGDAEIAEVAASLADELEAAGFVLWAPVASTLMARRGADTIELVFHARAVLATIGGERHYPNVPTNHVLIEAELL